MITSQKSIIESAVEIVYRFEVEPVKFSVILSFKYKYDLYCC